MLVGLSKYIDFLATTMRSQAKSKGLRSQANMFVLKNTELIFVYFANIFPDVGFIFCWLLFVVYPPIALFIFLYGFKYEWTRNSQKSLSHLGVLWMLNGAATTGYTQCAGFHSLNIYITIYSFFFACILISFIKATLYKYCPKSPFYLNGVACEFMNDGHVICKLVCVALRAKGPVKPEKTVSV